MVEDAEKKAIYQERFRGGDPRTHPAQSSEEGLGVCSRHNYDRTVVLFLMYIEKKSAVKVMIDLDKEATSGLGH